MDYHKIDAALAAALDEVPDPEERSLAVFIHTTHTPGQAEAAFLERLGVRGISGTRHVFTATLSPSAIAELSEQPWLRYLRLSRQMRLLDEG
jgi:hypothetical protein